METPRRILEKRYVRLVKHLLHNRGMTCSQVSALVQLIGRSGVSHIKHDRRWYDIPTPNYIVGEYLYFLHRNGKL